MNDSTNISAAVKPRSPWGVWWLNGITLGIYGLVWSYRTFKENGLPAGRYLLGITLGAVLIVPWLLVWSRTVQAIGASQERAGLSRTASLGMVVFLGCLGFHQVYVQRQVNRYAM
jgi:hypothetical protein